jgi:Flp pilus assembly CpaF family ATPase
MHIARFVIGEVRGPEIIPMLDALSTGGAGSLSTLHARSASHAVERMVSLALGAGGSWTEVFASRMVAESIDLIVHVDMRKTAAGLDRCVSEIVSVELGESGRAARTPLFTSAPHSGVLAGRGVPTGLVPTDIADYEAVGFDRSWLIGGDGQWVSPAGGREASGHA